MAESPVNGVGTTLASSITNVATTVSLTSATGFTNAQYHCLITDGTNYEIVLATALSGTTLTVTRAVEAYNGTTTAYAFASGSSITVVPTVASVVGLIEGQPYLTVTGVGNATTATRYVGGTSVGAPTTGTFAAGDWIVDLTGTIWVCTTAGTPGTWTNEIPNSLVNRSATATAGTGEFTIFGTTGTSGQTITLPAVAVNGSLYQIKNLSPYTVNILGGTNSISVSGTIYSASTPYTIPLNSAYTFAYSGGVWYCMVTTDINKMGGLPLTVAGGGTGLTTATAANNAIYSTSASALTAGTLPVAAGGTGLSTLGTAGQVLTVNSGATALQYSTPSGGSSTPNASTGSFPPSYYWSNVSYQSVDPLLASVYASSVGSAYQTPTRANVYFTGIYLPSGVTVNYLSFHCPTITSVAACYLGLYNSTTRLAQTSSFVANRYLNQQSLTSSYTTTSAGIYWVAFLVTTATTVPSITGTSNVFNLLSFGPTTSSGTLTVSTSYITGGYSTLPLTFSGVTPTNWNFHAWVGVG